MSLQAAIGKFFGAVDLEDGDAVFKMKGVRRIIKIGFILGFIAVNLLSYGLVYIGWIAAPPHDFIIPTGLSTTRLVITTFLLTYFYFKFNPEKLLDIDKQYNLNYIYREEKHKDLTVKEW